MNLVTCYELGVFHKEMPYEKLEPCEGKLSRTVLRGGNGSNAVLLPDQTLENKQKFISQIMTSKSPVRSCEDVDEAALSYAEIKALCAGDPRIKEKMDLDIEVSRLRLMKADHETRRFDLEDQVRKGFPKKIRQSQERIEGYKKDLEGLAAHPVPEKGFAGMTVDETHYTEKDKAGQALIEFCKHHFTTDPVPMGEYRGLSMSLEYNPVYKRFEATLKGTMSYHVELGSDVYGM